MNEKLEQYINSMNLTISVYDRLLLAPNNSEEQNIYYKAMKKAYTNVVTDLTIILVESNGSN